MFLETSAVVEYFIGGPAADEVIRKIDTATTDFHIGPTVEFEATSVLCSKLERTVDDTHALVMGLVHMVDAKRMTITPEIADAAVRAFARYGKGRGHPARLNFGDCFSYALCKAAGVPLLYVGADFSHTDLG